MIREIFISYSRRDLKKVKAIKSEIEQATSMECWMDINDIQADEEDYLDRIAEGIDKCRVFIFMLSKSSQESEHAVGELVAATKQQRKRGVHVVIINIDGCEMSTKFTVRFTTKNAILWSDAPQKDNLIRNLRDWLGVEETKETEEEEAKWRTQEEVKRKAEEEARKRAEEEAQRRAEKEAKRKAEEEAKRKAEEEAQRKAAEEEAKRKAEEEAQRKAAEEAKRKAEEEARKKAEEEEKKRGVEEDAIRKVKEEYNRLTTFQKVVTIKMHNIYAYGKNLNEKRAKIPHVLLLSLFPSAYCILSIMFSFCKESEGEIYFDTIMAFEQKVYLLFPSFEHCMYEIELAIFFLSLLTISAICLVYNDSHLIEKPIIENIILNIFMISLSAVAFLISALICTFVGWILTIFGEYLINLYIPSMTRGSLFVGTHFLISISMFFTYIGYFIVHKVDFST